MAEKRRQLTPNELIVARKLKAAYKSSGLNQECIAKKAGTTQSLVALYLNGKRPLGTDALFDICNAIGVSPADIDPDRIKKMMSVVVEEASAINQLYKKLDSASQKLITAVMKRMITA